jgi:hypothetical protein
MARVATKILREWPGRMLVPLIMNALKNEDCHSDPAKREINLLFLLR